MRLFKSKTEKVKLQSAYEKLSGKYCVYHHGIAVKTHNCGALFCKECLWSYTVCPRCNKPVDMKIECKKSEKNVSMPEPVPKYKLRVHAEQPVTAGKKVVKKKVMPTKPVKKEYEYL